MDTNFIILKIRVVDFPVLHEHAHFGRKYFSTYLSNHMYDWILQLYRLKKEWHLVIYYSFAFFV